MTIFFCLHSYLCQAIKLNKLKTKFLVNQSKICFEIKFSYHLWYDFWQYKKNNVLQYGLKCRLIINLVYVIKSSVHPNCLITLLTATSDNSINNILLALYKQQNSRNKFQHRFCITICH